MWSYWSNGGPAAWGKNYPAALGSKQSPIDINTAETVFDETLQKSPLTFNYFAGDCLSIRNTGTTWQIKLKNHAQSTITGPQLGDTYALDQVHCHWGISGDKGSEHTVNGARFSGEVHLVHHHVKMHNRDTPLQDDEGYAVLAVFLKETGEDNPVMEPLVELISQIKHKNDFVSLPEEGFDLTSLIPDKQEYWTYNGSLTTPPCCECVVWTVFCHPLTVSTRQMNILRSLLSIPVERVDSSHPELYDNFRPTQSLNGRVVRRSFP